MKCKTCAHPQCQAIDLALLTRTHTLEALSRQYGLTVSSLFRHKQHLVENLDRARDRLHNSQQLGQLLKLNAILDQVQRAVDAAAADGDVDRVLRGASAGARIIRQMSRMDVPLELDTVYRIISSPQWVTQASLLPTDPRLITDIHQTMADIAFSPCPDPDPDLAEDDDVNDEAVDEDEATAPETSPLENQNSELRTQDSEMLPQLLAQLSPTVNTDHETTPRDQREKSAKLPKKSRPIEHICEYYQSDNLSQKKFAKNPGVGRESEAHPASREEITSSTPNKPNCPQPETGNLQPETLTEPPPVYYPEYDRIVPLKNERYYGRGIF